MACHSNLVNSALAYASHGFSVIPIGSGKKPLVKFADKPPLTADQIKEIWQRYPLANIALKTEKCFVIDVDRHEDGVDGLESIKKLNHNEWFKNTLCERTAHGGYHFFFAKPADQRIEQAIGLLPGVDLKAHPNNYVVCAPSIVDGKAYKWLNHCKIKSPPSGLLSLIRSKKSEVISGKSDDSNYSTKRTVTTELFEKIVYGLGPTGGRNNALASFVGGLLRRGVEPDAAIQLAIIANDNTTDRLPDREVNRTCRSIFEAEARRREEMNDDG